MAVIEPDRRDLDIYDAEQEIPEDEKKQILYQIEKSISDSLEPVSPAAQPAKKASVFPLILNAAAAVILIAVVLMAGRVFEVRRDKLDLEIREVASAEGKILDEFKREAEEKLKEKDAAILRVLKQLGTLERERSQLTRIMELRIQEKERDMRRELEAELQAKREDLLSSGVAAAQIDRELLALETEKKRQIFDELRTFQEQIDALTQQKEEELLREKETARLSLEQATLEREELLLTTQKKERELLDRLRAEEGGNAAVTSIQDTLTVQERLVIDQIVGSYMAIAVMLAGKQYAEASAELTSLEAILRDKTVSELQAVERRKESDLRIIDTFQSLIAEAADRQSRAEAAESGEPASSPADAALIESLRLELLEKQQELTRLEAEAASMQEDTEEMQTIVVRTRSSVYGDVLQAIDRLQAAETPEELEALSRELSSASSEGSSYARLISALESLRTASFQAAESEALSYRILGTVTLVEADNLTILPMVNLPVRVGNRIEIRRILPTGESCRVGRGTLSHIEGERLVARIESLEVEGGVVVTDKVYLIVE